MKFNPEGLQKRENQELSYYKIVFNYDILNDSKKEFKQETEELKKKLREVIKDYNQKNDTNIEINYRFDLSLDNKEDSI